MLRGEAFWFLIVGTIGFVVDAGLTQGLSAFGLHPLFARVPAIGIAIFVTFLFNRKYTFRAEHTPFACALRDYYAANILSQSFNYALYMIFVIGFPFFKTYPFLAVIIGSLAAMAVSFCLSKYWVFRAR